ncbi:MAG: hypothetical protein HY901_13675 [Deltaproteobacteria bacterium]|nr:hypothetical protein [Deltaproteobacteria bacterium]
MNRLPLLFWAAALVLGTACPSKDPAAGPDAAAAQPDAAPLPGRDAAVESPDAATADASETDAGAPDSGVPPQRVLVPMHLLGDTPLTNLVHAPHFDPVSELWMGFDGNYAPLEMRLLTWARTPTGLPVLELRPAGGQRILVGHVRGGPAPLLASLWIGRDASAPQDPLSVALEGLVASAPTDSAFELVAEEESVREIDHVLWQRYSVRIEEEVLGVGWLVFSDESPRSLYLHAPVVVQDPTRALRPGARSRKPTPAEAEAIRRAKEKLRSKPPPQRTKW